MTLGAYIKQLRTKKNISQQKLAEMLYVDRSSVTRWESGKRIPDAIMITRLADCLGVDSGTLLSACDDNCETPNVIVVDDEKLILTNEVSALEQSLPSASITGFTKPSEALSFAGTNLVSIAFLDIELGKHSGFELCEELLKINSRTNVIFLTAFADYSLEAWKTRASAFLVKPLTPEIIQKSILKLHYPVRGL